MSTSPRDQQKLETLRLFREDLEFYAKHCLKIRDKTGNVDWFPGFNSAQRYVHDRIEQQARRTGRVRAIILKGRQQGISTYVAARYYRRASMFRGVGVYILSHEQAASDNLFKFVDRFQTNNPIAPQTGVSNVKELEFVRLDSSYVVATAGQKAGGRGRTITLFHGSEVAFWFSARDHFAASVQTVADLPGTEIILESTGNGASGEFYERWNDAVAGKSDYIPIFVPWFWQEEYTRRPPPDFELSDEPGDTGVSEAEYARLFELSHEKMAWRRAKIAELRSVQLFDQEYPASPEMAFQSADLDKTFIKPVLVLRARKRKNVVPAGPKIMGIDPSGPGKDRFGAALRQGLRLRWVKHRSVPETQEAVFWVKSLIDEELPDRVYIDLGGIGHAIYSLLTGLDTRMPDGRRYSDVVRGVNFGATSQHKLAMPKVPGPKNRRAEMWERSLNWLELEEGVQIPDDEVLQADASAPRVKPLISGDFLLESKDQMKARGMRSPDLWDSVVLTFADLDPIMANTGRRSGSRVRLKPRSEVASQTPASHDSAPRTGLPMTGGGENSWMGF